MRQETGQSLQHQGGSLVIGRIINKQDDETFPAAKKTARTCFFGCGRFDFVTKKEGSKFVHSLVLCGGKLSLYRISFAEINAK